MFPSAGYHYRDILYGAYKSDNPVEYLMEFLEPYKETLTRHQLIYLVKYLVNRELLRSGDIMKMVLVEEGESLSSAPHQLLSRFLYYATSLCHIWHRGDEKIAYRHCLTPKESTIVCYFDSNIPTSYLWFDVNITDGTIRLIQSNTTHMSDYMIRSYWKWIDGNNTETTEKTFTFDMDTGDTYVEVSSFAGDVPIIRVAVECVSGRVGITQELGIRHEWPFALLLTYTDTTDEYIFSKILYNTREGHLLPLLCAMHSLKT